jgi:coenzyme F420-reducing hydrogenase beta subunit
MPNLPKEKDCCGCAACVDLCPKKAISLKENENGYFFPFVNEDQCINCKLCEKNCHILHQDELKRNDLAYEKPYAAWTLDDELIKHSASGGIFAQIAKDFLQNGGFVYGAALQEDSTVKHIEISSVEELRKLQNSKYQQSNASGIYTQVKKRLTEGYKVLFSGVPCQAGALYTFLHYNEALLKNLFVLEIVCHGVPTNHLSKLALKFTGAKKILKYRTKSKGWLEGNRITYEMPDGSILECTKRRKDFLFRSYLTMSNIRENCYTCKYARIDRVSDLTLCDFWEVNQKKFNHRDGISLVLVNSARGRTLFVDNPHIYKEQVSWEESIPQNQNLYMPTNRQLFKGCFKISKIMNYPDWLCKVIFQNGFENKYINKIFFILQSLFTYPLKKKQKKEQARKAHETLKMLKDFQ